MHGAVRLSALFRLTRVQFLISGIILYLLGTLLALERGWDFELGRFVFGYLILGIAHVSLHFNNDYYDREGDTSEERTPVSGGSGVLQEYPDLAPAAFKIALLLTTVSILLGVIFTVYYSFPVWFLVFVVASNLIAWFYSAPPIKMAYRGYGEISTALAVGVLMPGMGYFVTSGSLDIWFLAISLPLVCYGFFFIFSVELPDLENDRRMGKVNLLVKRGRRIGYVGAVVATSLATTILVLMVITGIPEGLNVWPIALLSVMPLAVSVLAYIRNADRRESIVAQVKMNFASIFSFVLVFDLLLLFQIM